MRKLLILCLSLASLAPLSVARTARAQPQQPSDSERAAARQLFGDGVALQNAGHYADALDKFKRAQDVIQAPTNLLHIGQCDEALNKLVEAEEAYRAATRLPDNGIQAFVDAKNEAAQRVGQVEPRIPKLKIDVTPANVPNLAVQIDGQKVNAALIDQQVPLDPGSHTITANAPGYATAEKSIALQERESKSVALTLTQLTGIVYTNPDGTTATGPLPPPPPPPGPGTGGEGRVEKSTTSAPTSKLGHGFLLGVDLGYATASGEIYNTQKVSDVATGGGAFALEGGYHFSKVYFGAILELASYGQGSTPDPSITGPMDNTLTASTTTAHGTALGAKFAYISNPAGVASFYGEVGVDYRWFTYGTHFEDPGNSSRFVDITRTFSSPELVLGGGIYFRIGSWLRLLPKVSVGLGSFNKESTDCTSGGLLGCNIATTTTSGQVNDSSGHSFVFFGVGGFYDTARNEP